MLVTPNYSSLLINEVYPEDTGIYNVILKNPGGEARTSGHLQVETMFSDVPSPSDTEATSAPQFLQKLHNKEVPEGGRCRLDCVIIGQPEPEVNLLSFKLISTFCCW